MSSSLKNLALTVGSYFGRVAEGGNSMQHEIVGIDKDSGTNKKGEPFSRLDLHTQYGLRSVEGVAVEKLVFWNAEAKQLIKDGVAVGKFIQIVRDSSGRIIEVEVVVEA
jgi:hypothetical protein